MYNLKPVSSVLFSDLNHERKATTRVYFITLRSVDRPWTDRTDTKTNKTLRRECSHKNRIDNIDLVERPIPSQSSQATMCERFFTQTTRFPDLHGNLPDAFSEMELIDTVVLPAELSLQEFHSFALKYDLIWMSEGAFIATDFPFRYIFKNGPMTEEFRAMYNRTLGTYEYYLTIRFSAMSFSVFAASRRVATVFSDILVGMFARSNMPDCLFHAIAMSLQLGPSRRPLLPVSGEALTKLLTQGTCRKLEMHKFHLNESHFHALRRATSGLKLKLASFNFTAAIATTAFVECLQGMSCSLDMTWDNVNTSVLARALPGASHLLKLTLDKREGAIYDGSIFESLRANTALVESFQANTGLAELKVSTEFDFF
jgi:hypothetical protein